MPVTSTLVAGQQFWVINNSTGVVTVNSSGGNAVQVMQPGTTCLFTCVLITGTTAASWDAAYIYPTALIPYDLACQITGKPDSAAVVLRFVAPRAFTLSAAGQQGKAGTSATAQADFIVAVNGVTKATLRFAAAGTAISVVGGTAATIAAGDVITITAPTQDATLADIGFTLAGVLV